MSFSFTESPWLQGTWPRKQSDLDLGNSGLGENKAIPLLKILKQRTREVLSERGDLKWSLTECETTDKADRRWHARQGKKLTVPSKALRHCLFAGAYRRDWREHLQNTMSRSKLHHLQCLNRLNKTQRPFGSKWKIRCGLWSGLQAMWPRICSRNGTIVKEKGWTGP